MPVWPPAPIGKAVARYTDPAKPKALLTEKKAQRVETHTKLAKQKRDAKIEAQRVAKAKAQWAEYHAKNAAKAERKAKRQAEYVRQVKAESEAWSKRKAEADEAARLRMVTVQWTYRHNKGTAKAQREATIEAQREAYEAQQAAFNARVQALRNRRRPPLGVGPNFEDKDELKGMMRDAKHPNIVRGQEGTRPFLSQRVAIEERKTGSFCVNLDQRFGTAGRR